MARKRRRTRKRRPRQTKRAPRTTGIYVEYYQPAFAEFTAELMASGYTTELPSPKRRSFWQLVAPGQYSGRAALDFLHAYLSSLEQELASVISRHSLAYWLHAYRRLLPASPGDDKRPATVLLTRGVLEEAVQKYALLHTCTGVGISSSVPEEDVLDGRLMRPEFAFLRKAMREKPQLVLTRFGFDQYRQLYELEKLAYEIWRSMAQRRIVGKGGRIVVTDGPTCVGSGGPGELFRLTKLYDARHGGMIYASQTGTVFPETPEASARAGLILLPRYNVALERELAAEFFRRAYRICVPPAYVPNFNWLPFNLRGYAQAHAPFSQPFREQQGVSLEAVLTVIAALCVRALYTWQEDTRLLLRSWQRAYDGPFLRSYVTAEVEAFALPACQTLGYRFDDIRPELGRATEFLDLTLRDRSQISLQTGGPAAVFLPFGQDRLFIDYAWLLDTLLSLFYRVEVPDQNFKGDALERLIRPAKSALPTSMLKALDGSAKQIDAAFAVGDALVIVECRARGKSFGLHRGDPTAVAWRRRYVVEPALADADDKARWLSLHPRGRNYDATRFKRILPVALTPFPEYVHSLDPHYWLTESLPRILTPEELKRALSDGTLRRAIDGGRNVIRVAPWTS